MFIRIYIKLHGFITYIILLTIKMKKIKNKIMGRYILIFRQSFKPSCDFPWVLSMLFTVVFFFFFLRKRMIFKGHNNFIIFPHFIRSSKNLEQTIKNM